MQEEERWKCKKCGRIFGDGFALGGHRSHCNKLQPPAPPVSEQLIVAVPVPQIPVEAEKLDIEKGEVSQEQVQEILEGEWWTIKQLADAVNYTTIWITRMCQDRRIKAIKPTGGQWRIPKSEVQRVMKGGIPPLPRLEKPVEEPTRIEVPADKIAKVAPSREEPKEEVERKKESPWWLLSYRSGKR